MTASSIIAAYRQLLGPKPRLSFFTSIPIPSELARAVWDCLDTRDILVLQPFVHYETVVHRNNKNFVDPGLGKVLISAFKTRQLIGGAGRSEGTWQREDYAPFSRKKIFGADILPAIRVVAADGFVSYAGFENDLRNFTPRTFFLLEFLNLNLIILIIIYPPEDSI